MDPRLKEIAVSFFETNPSCKDDVMRAFFAFNCDHFREHTGAHNFLSVLRNAKCVWCGRDRELVRYDELPPECQCRPLDIPDIKETILNEEQAYFALLKRAPVVYSSWIKRHGEDALSMKRLYETHGISKEDV